MKSGMKMLVCFSRRGKIKYFKKHRNVCCYGIILMSLFLPWNIAYIVFQLRYILLFSPCLYLPLFSISAHAVAFVLLPWQIPEIEEGTNDTNHAEVVTTPSKEKKVKVRMNIFYFLFYSVKWRKINIEIL